MSDAQLRLEVTAGEIETNDLAVLVAHGYGMTSSVDHWCPLANFFSTPAAAMAWAESNRVDGRAVPVTAIAPQLIERWSTLLNHQPSG